MSLLCDRPGGNYRGWRMRMEDEDGGGSRTASVAFKGYC